MADNPHLYRPDKMPRNDGESSMQHPKQLGSGRHLLDDMSAPQLARRDGWDHSASYGENLALIGSAEPALHPTLRNDAKYVAGPPGLPHTGNPGPMSRIPWETDRHSNRSPANIHRRPPSNTIDISASRSQQQQFYAHPEQSTTGAIAAPTVPTTRTQQHYRSSPAGQITSMGPQHNDINKGMSHKEPPPEVLALLDAVQKRNQAEIARLIDNGVDINSVQTGFTPLHLAAHAGDVETIEYLLIRGADVKIRDHYGQTAEFYSKKCNLSVEKLLQNIKLVSKPRKKKLAAVPPVSPWRQSFGEAIMPNAPPYIADVQSLVFQQHLAYQDMVVSQISAQVASQLTPQANNNLRDRSHTAVTYNTPSLPKAKAIEDNHSKTSDRHSQLLQPSYDRFPSPFEHMMRPSHNNSPFPSGIDHLKQTQQPYSESAATKVTGSRLAINGSKQSSRISEQSLQYPNKMNHDSVSSFAKPEQFKSHESYHKHFSASSESKKQAPSFLIDDITKSTTSPSHNPPPHNDSMSKSMYGSQHATPRRDQGALPIGIDRSRITSPFSNDFYRLSGPTTVDTRSRYSSSSITSASPLKIPTAPSFPYPMYSPFPVQLYNPYGVHSGLSVPSYANQQDMNLKREHEQHIAQRQMYDYKSQTRTASEPSNPKSHSNSAYPPSSSDTRGHVYQNQESRGRSDIGWNANESSHSNHRSKSDAKSTLEANHISSNSDHYRHPKMPNNYPPHHRANVASSHHHPHLDDSDGQAEVAMPNDTNVRHLAEQHKPDTDLRPFLHHTERPTSKESLQAKSIEATSDPMRCNENQTSSSNLNLTETLQEVTQVDNEFSPNPMNYAKYPPSPARNKQTSPPAKPHPVLSSSIAVHDETATHQEDISQTITTSHSPKKQKAGEGEEKIQSDFVKDKSENSAETKLNGKKGRKRKATDTEDVHDKMSPSKSTDQDDMSRTFSSENDAASRREKRPRKSETEDEYIYDWGYDDFSSTEPENDDSEDEDFHCPLQAALPNRRMKKGLVRNRPMRHSSRRSGGRLQISSSFDEPLSEEEEASISKVTSQRSKSPKRAKQRKMDEKSGKLRRIKKSRRLSSESASSLACLEQISDSENDILEKKKQKRMISSDKEDTEPDSKSPSKTKSRKKNADEKHGSPVKKKDSNDDSKNGTDHKSHKHNKSSANKKRKSKSSSKHEENNFEHKNCDNTEQRKKKKIKKMRIPSEGSNDNTCGPRFSLKMSPSPKPMSSIDLKMTNMSEIFPSEEENMLPGISRSLIELYTGKPSQSDSPTHIAENLPADTQTNKVQIENQLFGNELTETEAQALSDAFKLANDNLSKTQQESISHSPHEMPHNTVSSDDSNKNKTNFPEKSTEGFAPKSLSKEHRGHEKIKKKRGRKPKSQQFEQILSSDGSKSVQSIDGQITATPKSHKLKHKEHKFDVKGRVLYNPRKGRPPGSANKNKVNDKKVLSADKKLHKSSKKKISKHLGKAPENTVIKQESIENSDKIDMVPSPSMDTSFKPLDNISRPQTPVLVKTERSNLNESPCSSLTGTPSHSFLTLQHPSMSRASTPLNILKERRTPSHPSPLPPNMKKLTCNSAIGETLLHKAVRHGYMDNIQHYLERGFDVNTKDNAGYTALHEACVHGKLEAAKILLEFGADVNINSLDGTRPIHDAVEYDRIEMTRLLLACGADPMLSKFSGRAIKDMFRSKDMKTFIQAYLKELRPFSEDSSEDPTFLWRFPASAILDDTNSLGCDSLVNPPSEDTHCEDMDFEVFEDFPQDTYNVQPTETSNRASFCLLSDILRNRGCSRGDFLLEFPVDIKTMPTQKLVEAAAGNWAPKKSIRLGDFSEPFAELITANKLIGKATALRVCSNGDVHTLPVNRPKSRAPRKIYPDDHFSEGNFAGRDSQDHINESFRSSLTRQESADIPCCSHSSNQSYENCQSPSFTETQQSGGPKTLLDTPLHSQDCENKEPEQWSRNSPEEETVPESLDNLPQNTPTVNGVPEDRPVLNGFPMTEDNTRTWPLNNHLSEKYLKTAVPVGPEVRLSLPSGPAHYAPTSELANNKPDAQNKAIHLYSENKHAVLNHHQFDTNVVYDANLSMVQLQDKDSSLAKLCKEVSQVDPGKKKFCLFNNVSLSDKTKSPQQTCSHIPEINERERAIL